MQPHQEQEFDGTDADNVFAGRASEHKPINVSGITDPLADSSVPVNAAFRPQDKVQFQVAVTNLIKNLPDDTMSRYYDVLKTAIEEDQKKEEKEMSKDMQTEALVRKQVRKMISEMFTEPAVEDEEDSPRKEANFAEIAKELGFSVSGAKQAVDKAISKAKWLGPRVGTDDFEIMVLGAMKDYIRHLQSSGELSDDDVRLMHDHPDIVRELDGFREFFHNYVRRAGFKHTKTEGSLAGLRKGPAGGKPTLKQLVDMLGSKLLNGSEAAAYEAALQGRVGDDNSAYDALYIAAKRRGLVEAPVKGRSYAFKPGDKVVLLGDDGDPIPGKEGVVRKIHALGDMADVDFGNGDVYGITFRRMMKLGAHGYPVV